MTTIKYPDPVSGTWKVVGGMPPDAPSDNSTYGRKNGAWSQVSSGMADAPSDGKLYGRKDGAWVEVTAAAIGIGSGFVAIGPTVDSPTKMAVIDTPFSLIRYV